MGLLEALKKTKMIVKWIDSPEGRVIKPEWYLSLEYDYKNPQSKNPLELKKEMSNWLVELNNEIFKGLPSQSRYLSGALSISLLTGEYPHQDTNTDIAMFAQKSGLEAHFNAAKKHGFYPMRRTSAKLKSSSPIKYHFFHPVSINELFPYGNFDQKAGRNLELTRINPSANIICTDFIPQNHIKIYLHKNLDGSLICVEDKKPIAYPAEYFKGSPVQVGNARFYVIDPRYTRLKLQQVVASHERNFTKHKPDLDRLERFLEEHRSEYPIG